jgi:protein-L-isoaspartate(D-aspartate) O-methyltransferase
MTFPPPAGILCEEVKPAPRFADLRREMVEDQLVARGIRDPRVLDAMGRVPREAFVPHESAHLAYADQAFPIGGGQTISQPYVVALTMESAEIRADDRVLDIGTGCGYAAAVASLLAREVWSVERDTTLAVAALERLRRLGYRNVHVAVGDGSWGWAAHWPYGVVLAAAACPEVPTMWLAQLARGGRLVAPVGPADAQHLVRVSKSSMGIVRRKLIPVRYVPLVIGDGADDLVELP